MIHRCMRCGEIVSKGILVSHLCKDEILKLKQENEELQKEINIERDRKGVILCDVIDRNKRLESENEQLQYKIIGIMHFVDKWFDKIDETVDEQIRAGNAREIALNEIEKLIKENEKLKEILKKCSPMTVDNKDGLRLTCKFCEGIKYHTENCEYIKLTDGVKL